jgi:hypothetical protein
MARITIAHLKRQVADSQAYAMGLQTQIDALKAENACLLEIVESPNGDVDFDYTTAVGISRSSEKHTTITCLPNRSGDFKYIVIRCSMERHAQFVAEFARYKTKAK